MESGCPIRKGEEVSHLGTSVPVGCQSVLALGLVSVREAFGHDRRSRGDDERNGENELLHESSPLECGRLIRRSAGWPRVPFEHQLGRPSESVCPIAVGYGVGALGGQRQRDGLFTLLDQHDLRKSLCSGDATHKEEAINVSARKPCNDVSANPCALPGSCRCAGRNAGAHADR